MHDTPLAPGTHGQDYTDRLERLRASWWKRLMPTQAPYRWHIRRLNLGLTLDIGCGIGRNLAHLGGRAVGVDHNPTSVAACRSQGFEAYTTEDFFASRYARPEMFDSAVAAHVLEHMADSEAYEVMSQYVPFVRTGGLVVFITPQERGFASDETHVRFIGFPEAAELARTLGLTVVRQYSFPLPRPLGRVFTYNEFITVARKGPRR